MQFFDPKTSLAGERNIRVGITGTGAANPTKRWGQGVTVTRLAAGVYLITFADNNGFFQGWGQDLGADTPGNVKNYSVVRGAYDPATRSITVNVFNGSGVATDLAALQYLDMEFRFAATSVAS